MKRWLAIILLISATTTFAQESPLKKLVKAKKEQQVPFKSITAFTISANKELAKRGTYHQLELAPSFSTQLLGERPQAIELPIPIAPDKSITCELIRFSLGNIQYTENNNIMLQDIKEPVTYRGIVADDTGKSVVILTVNDEYLSLVATMSDKTVLQVTKADEKSANTYRLYDNRLINFPKAVPANCGTSDKAGPTASNGVNITGAVLKEQGLSPKCINVFVDCFDSTYKNFGNSKQKTVNFVYELFNSVITGFYASQVYSALKNKYENADTSLAVQSNRQEWAVYKKAKLELFDNINNLKDSMEMNFAYNINYISTQLIDGDSDDPQNHTYGNSIFKLSPNLNHGTYVTGLIAAQRNILGIDGIADNVLIMPIVASTQVGDERDKDLANAIHYAVDNGAQIINISFSKIYSTNKALVDEAIQYAGKKEVLIIHCAGNDGVDIDSADNYHFPMPILENGKRTTNFITVGWSRQLFDYRLAHPNSCYGKLNVDLFAPGSDIYTTVPGNNYDFESGSSMSAPIVTGVAALLLSYFPALSIQEVKETILKSVFKPDQMVNKPHTKIQVPFSSLSKTGGIVNAYRAVKLATEMTKSGKKYWLVFLFLK